MTDIKSATRPELYFPRPAPDGASSDGVLGGNRLTTPGVRTRVNRSSSTGVSARVRLARSAADRVFGTSAGCGGASD
jgi:hypothetical protein